MRPPARALILALGALAFVALASRAAPAIGAVRSGRSVPAPSPHAVNVTIKGPVALVEVARALPAGRGETLLDIALPPRSALIDVEVGARGRWTRARSAEADKARDSYLASVRARGLGAAAEPFDDSASYRLRVLAPPDGARGDADLFVRYTFSTLVEPAGTRWRIRFPPAPEATPIGADVQATVLAPPGQTLADVDIAGVRTVAPRGGKRAVANGQSSERTGWEISFGLGSGAGGAPATSRPGGPWLAETMAAAAVLPGRDSALALAVRTSLPPSTALPERVLLVLDRSRSVGPAGLALERDIARALLEALPPSTQFDALFFDRGQKRLFPAARAATLEALGALDDEMVPARLQNGSDLEGALRAAGDLLRREASSFGPRALCVLVTDAAIPDDQTGAALGAALGRAPGVDLQLALLAVRPPGDEPAAARVRKALRTLAAERGGVEAEIAATQISDGVRVALDSLRRGGDLHSVRLGAGDDARHVAAALPPGAGAAGVVRLRGRAPVATELRATTAGRTVRSAVRPIAVEATWLAPHASPGGAPPPSETRLAATPAAVLLVEPVVRPEPVEAGPPGKRGEMDRVVVRNTLSLGYMPRARACYQNRPMGTPSARELAGRVRLALDLVRGEVSNAEVQLSTLKQADIERCLRDAAFDIEVPRAWRSDAPVSAVLNLVFAPRSAEAQKRMNDDSPVGPEIDLILEQLPPEVDVGDILLTAPPPALPPIPPAPAPPPAPAKPTEPPVPQQFE